MSPGWVKSYLEPNPKSSWRKLWRVLSTTPSNVAMTGRRWTCSTKLHPRSATRIGGNPPSRSRRSWFSHRIHSEPSKRNNTLPRRGSSSTRSSMPLRTNCESDVRDRSNKTLHSSEQKNIVPFTTAMGTEPSTARTFGGTWKNSSARASSKNTSLPPKRPLGQHNWQLCHLPNRNTWSPIQSNWVIPYLQ